MPKELTESVLCRLSTEALVAFLGQAEKFECTVRPGVGMMLSNEPAADLNYVVAGRGASDRGDLGDGFRACIDRELPFLALVFPEAGEDSRRVAGQLGMVHVVDFPLMVWDGAPVEASGNEAIEVRRASGEAGGRASAAVLGAAFGIAEEFMRRAMPAALMESPGVDVYLAFEEGRPVGSVTLTYHGDTCGIWAMGTDASRQRRGVGRRLLSTAMCEAGSQGVRRFFLGSTPAGYRLYESLGFETRFAAQVWAFGETRQA
jgi:GNAT superfamily N-acetyltransferase